MGLVRSTIEEAQLASAKAADALIERELADRTLRVRKMSELRDLIVEDAYFLKLHGIRFVEPNSDRDIMHKHEDVEALSILFLERPRGCEECLCSISYDVDAASYRIQKWDRIDSISCDLEQVADSAECAVRLGSLLHELFESLPNEDQLRNA